MDVQDVYVFISFTRHAGGTTYVYPTWRAELDGHEVEGGRTRREAERNVRAAMREGRISRLPIVVERKGG